MSAVTITIILAFGTLPGLFADEQKAIDILEKQGFSNIKIVNKDWVFVALVGCGQGDAAMFTAQATNPIGKNVEIKVCVGWPFKGATIRN
ncbi:MAG: hypothetical protein HYW70_03360 [Candidatus Nealsonbacteria bacterium]|nr:hypothetical protein [Candidatus Nealsonbacteria bacterium]